MDDGTPIPSRQAEIEQLQTSEMLNRVLAGLYPESFYHPIWLYYSGEYRNPSSELIHNLIQSAQQLQNADDANDACQILLVCAVLHSRINDLPVALTTAQQALELAENHNLKQASIWSAWGVCALCVNRGDYQTAAKLLAWLQTKLRQEDQWILANHLDLIKMALSSGSNSGRFFQIILDMFSRWGEPEPAKEVNHVVSSSKEQVLVQHQLISSPSKPVWKRWKKSLKKFWGSRSFSKWYQRAEEPRQEDMKTAVMPPTNKLPVRRSTVKVNNYAKKPDQLTMMKLKTMLNSLGSASVSLTVHLLGEFRVALNDKPINPFPHGRWRAIFEYLVFHHHQNIPREVLMDLFWPEADPASARNSLNVAFYNIRKALRSVTDFPIILFNDGAYGLNPEIEVWIDVEEFDSHIKIAQKLESEGEINKAKVKLEIAANLYQGDFLAEDLHEEWAVYHRERLRAQYMDAISHLCHIYYHQGQYTACATLCQLILKYDSCHEEAHCRLMRCYGRQNQYHLAIRQYHICADVLQAELGVEPAIQTVKLYERARRREHTQPL